MKQLWARVHDHKLQTDERLSKVVERVESTDFSVGCISEKLCDLRKERDTLKDEVCYLQSQSMRNNLVFGNIQEIDSEDTEKVLRQFLVEKMKIAQDLVNEIRFERVHRMGLKTVRKSRNIVAKFTFFKERELVRKHWKSIQGTEYFVIEQFTKEVVDKRRKLFSKLKDYKKDGKKAWISYDTLYVEGKPEKLD